MAERLLYFGGSSQPLGCRSQVSRGTSSKRQIARAFHWVRTETNRSPLKYDHISPRSIARVISRSRKRGRCENRPLGSTIFFHPFNPEFRANMRKQVSRKRQDEVRPVCASVIVSARSAVIDTSPCFMEASWTPGAPLRTVDGGCAECSFLRN